MNLTNYHSHCVFCDGRADMESFVRFAVAQGFTSYGISSHAPLPYHTAWRSEERRVGKECSAPSRSRASPSTDEKIMVICSF